MSPFWRFGPPLFREERLVAEAVGLWSRGARVSNARRRQWADYAAPPGTLSSSGCVERALFPAGGDAGEKDEYHGQPQRHEGRIESNAQICG